MTQAAMLGRKIGQALLAAGAGLVVCLLSLLALLVTLACAPPLRRLADFLHDSDQAP